MKKEKEDTAVIFASCCDISREQDRIALRMEMPGVAKESLDIRVDGDLLIIDGKKNIPAIQGKYHLREIRNGSYHHEFTIDDTIDRNKIDASIKNGIVLLVLGLKDSVKPRKITVNAE